MQVDHKILLGGWILFGKMGATLYSKAPYIWEYMVYTDDSPLSGPVLSAKLQRQITVY